MELLTIFTIFIAIGLLLWGYGIGIKRNLHLVPGYIPGRIKDERGYAIWIGYNLLGMGTLGAIDALLQVFFPETHLTMFIAFAIIIVPALSIRIIMGKKRYETGR